MIVYKILSVFGIALIIFIMWLMSENRKKFPWRIIFIGIALQFLLAFFIFFFPAGYKVFSWLGLQIKSFLEFSRVGAAFLFGNALTEQHSEIFGMQFAIILVSVIVFFSTIVSILYYLGVIQRIIFWIAWLMQKTLGTSGTESLSAAANIFFGQAEAPLIVRHYLDSASRSEINAIMTVGFSTIAGTVMAAYIQMGIDPMLLIAASIISAPGGLILAKIVVPPTGEEISLSEINSKEVFKEKNILLTISNGASDGLKLAFAIIAMLIAFVSLIAMLDAGFALVDGWLENIGIHFFPNSLSELFSYIFQPFAYIVGIPHEEAKIFGSLLGKKIAINEFIAYSDLAVLIKSGELSKRTITLSTLALCGFANFGSVAIQLGAFTQLMPNKKAEVSSLGLKSMVIGAFANLLTAAIVSLII